MDIKPENHQKANEADHPNWATASTAESNPLQGTEDPRNRTRAGIPMPSCGRARRGGVGHGA
jgi:hypothetical protein